MIKTVIITLVGLGAIGTGTHSIKPQSFELNAGTLTLRSDDDGFKTILDEKVDFGLKITSETGRVFAIRF